jgi:guanylate cyclase soluble subunit beta
VAETTANLINEATSYPITISDFCQAFPHHFCFDKNLVLEHVGIHMQKMLPICRRGETRLSDILHLVHPEISLTFDSLITFRNSTFVFQIKDSSFAANADLTISQFPVTLKGAMVAVDNNKFVGLQVCPKIKPSFRLFSCKFFQK